MAKFLCICGTIIQTSGPIPNELEWKIISDLEFDRFEGLVDAEEVYVASRPVFKCHTCGRLWIFWRGVDEPPQCYKPESPTELGEVDT
ncbi:hypothetical protein EDC02_1096 [Micromonospora sp. Llam0]|nr:hypothetical protein EDC02_1096 [Micromonospora sp. Llam0]